MQRPRRNTTGATRPPPLLHQAISNSHRYQRSALEYTTPLLAVTSTRVARHQTPAPNQANRAKMEQTLTQSPHKPSTDSSEREYVNVAALQQDMLLELKDSVVQASGADFIFRLLSVGLNRRKITTRSINRFLDSSKEYCQKSKSWVNYPRAPTAENELYAPGVTIINEIMSHFYHHGDKRKAQDGSNVKLNIISDGNELKVAPDILILGTGNSVSSCKTILAPRNFKQCICPADFKRDCGLSDKQDCVQLGVYARSCFMEQNNRDFVFSFIWTQSKLKLYKFDRSGCITSTWIDFHNDAETFVQIILGISSLREEDVGFDTSVIWNSDGSRTITFHPDAMLSKETTKMKKYRNCIVALNTTGKPFYRSTIRGRGTCGWPVVDPNTGDNLLVKDCWRADGRTPEWEFLEKCLGLDGVGQIVAYQDNIKRVSQTRGGEDMQGILDRTFCRIVLQLYGGSITDTTTTYELLTVFRDAVAGHRNMYEEAEILHRDVSAGNILIGDPKSKANRGRLVDMDLAIWVKDLGTLSGDYRTGTRAFQSVKVLSNNNNTPLGHHDHMDDLESFFYVLCWIVFGYSQPKIRDHPLPEFLDAWESPVTSHCSSMKGHFMRNGPVQLPVERFGPEVLELIEKLRLFFQPRMEDIVKATRVLNRVPFPTDTGLNAELDYLNFLAIIDEAIEKLSGTGDTSRDATPTSTPSDLSSSILQCGGDERSYKASEFTPHMDGTGSTTNSISPDVVMSILPPCIAPSPQASGSHHRPGAIESGDSGRSRKRERCDSSAVDAKKSKAGAEGSRNVPRKPESTQSSRRRRSKPSTEDNANARGNSTRTRSSRGIRRSRSFGQALS